MHGVLRGISNIATAGKDFKHLWWAGPQNLVLWVKSWPWQKGDLPLSSAAGGLQPGCLEQGNPPPEGTCNSFVRPFELLKTCIRELLKCSWRINLTDFTESIKSRPSFSVLGSLGAANLSFHEIWELFRMAAPPWIWQMWVKLPREVHYLTCREIIVSVNRQ